MKVWTDKFGLVIEEGELNLGDIISIEFPIEFIEITVNSMRVNNVDVKKAKTNEGVGLPWPISDNKLRDGMKVYRVT